MNSDYAPIPLIANTPGKLMDKILEFQSIQGGKCGIVTIYFDGKNHICWIMPLKGLGSSIDGI